MNAENLNSSQKEISLIDLLIVVWNNKITFFIIFLFFLISGYLYYSYKPVIGSKINESIATINILIEESTYVPNKPIITQFQNNLLSSYNYEKWSNQNEDLSNHFVQGSTSNLIFNDLHHTIKARYYSKKQLEGIESYLDFITKDISKKYTFDYSNALFAKSNQQKIEVKKNLQMKKANLQKTIETKNIVLKASEEQLAFILNNVSKDRQNTPGVTLRILDLRNNIRIVTEELKRLNNEINDDFLSIALNNDLNSIDAMIKNKINKNFQVIKVGRIETSFVESRQPSFLLVIISSLILGLVVSIVTVLLIEEFKKRRNSILK